MNNTKFVETKKIAKQLYNKLDCCPEYVKWKETMKKTWHEIDGHEEEAVYTLSSCEIDFSNDIISEIKKIILEHKQKYGSSRSDYFHEIFWTNVETAKKVLTEHSKDINKIFKKAAWQAIKLWCESYNININRERQDYYSWGKRHDECYSQYVNITLRSWAWDGYIRMADYEKIVKIFIECIYKEASISIENN
jgi:hypothetical protein